MKQESNMKQKLKHHRTWGMMLLIGCIMLSMGTLAWSDDDERYEHANKDDAKYSESKSSSGWQRTTGVAVVNNKLYQSECSACHFAYQPGFLPARSWVKLMSSLDDHFGENAELDEPARSAIEQYLLAHAADRLPNRFSRSVMRSIKGSETPLQISQTSYFQRKHHEIPARMVKNNPKVRSFANCASCHQGAAKGYFDEDAVRIPGFGNWED